MLYANKQEYETLKEFLPPDTQVDSEIATDFIIQGVEKNRSYERKDIRDFIHSIRDGRLFDQLKDLSNNKEEYEPFIIIEGLGFWDVQSRKWLNLKAFFETYPEKKMSFYEALVAFRSFGVGLVITMDKADTALFLTYENSKLGKPKVKKDYPLRSGFRKDWDNEKKKLYLLECFGPATAKALLKEFKSIWLLMLINESLGMKTDEQVKENTISILSAVTLESGRRLGKKKGTEIYQVLFA